MKMWTTNEIIAEIMFPGECDKLSKWEEYTIKGGLPPAIMEEIFDKYINATMIFADCKVLLVGMGNPYFYNLATGYFGKEHIYVIEDNESKFKYLDRDDIKNIKFVDFDNLSENDFVFDGNMKFDKIIMSLPCNKKLHKKILDNALPYLADRGVARSLNSVTWLQDPLIEYEPVYRFG